MTSPSPPRIAPILAAPCARRPTPRGWRAILAALGALHPRGWLPPIFAVLWALRLAPRGWRAPILAALCALHPRGWLPPIFAVLCALRPAPRGRLPPIFAVLSALRPHPRGWRSPAPRGWLPPILAVLCALPRLADASELDRAVLGLFADLELEQRPGVLDARARLALTVDAEDEELARLIRGLARGWLAGHPARVREVAPGEGLQARALGGGADWLLLITVRAGEALHASAELRRIDLGLWGDASGTRPVLATATRTLAASAAPVIAAVEPEPPAPAAPRWVLGAAREVFAREGAIIAATACDLDGDGLDELVVLDAAGLSVWRLRGAQLEAAGEQRFELPPAPEPTREVAGTVTCLRPGGGARAGSGGPGSGGAERAPASGGQPRGAERDSGGPGSAGHLRGAERDSGGPGSAGHLRSPERDSGGHGGTGTHLRSERAAAPQRTWAGPSSSSPALAFGHGRAAGAHYVRVEGRGPFTFTLSSGGAEAGVPLAELPGGAQLHGVFDAPLGRFASFVLRRGEERAAFITPVPLLEVRAAGGELFAVTAGHRLLHASASAPGAFEDLGPSGPGIAVLPGGAAFASTSAEPGPGDRLSLRGPGALASEVDFDRPIVATAAGHFRSGERPDLLVVVDRHRRRGAAGRPSLFLVEVLPAPPPRGP